MAISAQIFRAFAITSHEGLEKIDEDYRESTGLTEYFPWAQGLPYTAIAERVMPDREGEWQSTLYFVHTMHKTNFGIQNICKMANEFIEEQKKEANLEILSISAGLRDSALALDCLVRGYGDSKLHFRDFFEYIGETVEEVEEVQEKKKTIGGELIVPDEIKNFRYTPEEIEKHNKAYAAEMEILKNSSIEKPFLNSIDTYVPAHLPVPADTTDLVYSLQEKQRDIKLFGTYEEFDNVFKNVLNYVSGVEYYHYTSVMQGDETEASFLEFLKGYVESTFIAKGKFHAEDWPILKERLNTALFKFYVVQDAIDDPKVTDINITAPDTIRCRVYGDAYMSDLTFINREDYLRFINGICIRCGRRQQVASQTFTYELDNNYVLRISLYAEYVNSVPWPYMQIRKVSRKKPLADELIKAGMLTPKLRDYLIDCGKTSRGVVFAGPPGSGKTVALNWFLEEAYEQAAEILVIQENDELFAYRKGVRFQHIVDYSGDDRFKPVSLEELGRLALVAGANVFVIGEVKGAEICSAITLSNSGCRTAMTIHSPSSTETLDKMADLALRGDGVKNIDQAKSMLKSFQTIVYLERFQVKEISEVIGYDEEKHNIKYRCIYRADQDKDRLNQKKKSLVTETVEEEKSKTVSSKTVSKEEEKADRKAFFAPMPGAKNKKVRLPK